MRNKLFIGIAVVVIGLLGWWKFGSDRGGSQENAMVSGTPSQPQNMRGLLGDGKRQQCTYATEMGGAKTSGTVYFRDGKMRSDFETEVSGKTVASHMIIANEVMYMWSDASTGGFKTAIPSSSPGATASVEQGLNLDATGQFDCQDASPSADLFLVPTTVTFTDYSAMQAKGTPSAADMKALQCQACAQVPESSRAECLAALQCN